MTGRAISGSDAFSKLIEAFQAGRSLEAEALCQTILAADPHRADALMMLGVIQAQRGDLQTALATINRSLGIAPHVALTQYYHGMVLSALGRPAEAIDAYRRATDLDPSLAEAYLKCGTLLLAQARPAEAFDAFARTLRLRPGDIQAQCGRSTALTHLGRFAEALAGLDAVLAVAPDFTDALDKRSEIYGNLGRFDAAIADSQRSLRVNPNGPAALVNLAAAFFGLDRIEEAHAALDRALALDPGRLTAIHFKGVILGKLGRLAEALSELERVVALTPNDPAIHTNMGNVLSLMNRHREALACYNRAILLDANFVKAYDGRATVLRAQGLLELALDDCNRVLELDPKFGLAATQRLMLKGLLCDWSNRDADIGDLARRIRDGEDVKPWTVIAALDDPDLQMKAARRHDEAKRPVMALKRTTAHERLRIAYLSPDFRDHPVAYQIVQLLEHHDRTQVEIYAVCLKNAEQSAIRTRLANAVDYFEPAGLRGDAEIAQYLADQEIDIAVDLAGNTGLTRPRILSFRPTPVAVSYLGHPGTTGRAHIDYILADGEVIPPESERYYSECVVRLPASFFPTSLPPAKPKPLSRVEAGLPDTGFVFCGFNTAYKLTPAMFDVWMRLLGAAQGSILWLNVSHDSARANLRREAASRHVSPERLIFAERVADRDDYRARIALADLHLDSLPYNAHSTASDLLQAGVPVLTCRGRSFAARVAASMLTALGLPELIADDLAGYEAIALALAQSPQRLAAVRSKLARHQIDSPLFDTARLTRNVETAYQMMWQRHSEGLPPAGFSVAG